MYTTPIAITAASDTDSNDQIDSPSTNSPLYLNDRVDSPTSRSRLKQLKKSATYKTSYLERHLPRVTTLLGDRPRSRLLTAALFTLIITWLFREAFFIFFLTSPLIFYVPPSFSLLVKLPPTALAEIGSGALQDTSVNVVDAFALPAQGIALRASIATLAGNEGGWWSEDYGFEDTHLDFAGVPINGHYGFPGIPPRALRVPLLGGSTTMSASDGRATFSHLYVASALPGSYMLSAAFNENNSTLLPKSLGIVTVVSSLLSATLSNTKSIRPVAVGGLLPSLSVTLTGAFGIPISGKRALLLSAPFDAAEFSYTLPAGTFRTRTAMLSGGAAVDGTYAVAGAVLSEPSNIFGVAEFHNVTLTAAAGMRARFIVVCEGMIAKTADGSTAFTVVIDRSVPLRLTLVSQPSPSLLEGTVFAKQPIVLVEAQSESGEWTPAVGVAVIAAPHMQAGFRSTNVMSPAGAAELGIAAGTEDAVLANLGRIKLTRGFASLPSNSSGFAQFVNLGMTRHGPAGDYTIGFWAAGKFTESNNVSVLSSVASVEWVQAGSGGEFPFADLDPSFNKLFPGVLPYISNDNGTAVGSVVCNWPTCATADVLQTSAGFPTYLQGALDLPPVWADGDQPDIPTKVSGSLTTGLHLVIKDAAGNVLAGKSASPVVTGASIELLEFPYTGASVSRLRVPLFMTAGSGFTATGLAKKQRKYNTPISTVEGAIVFFRENLDLQRGTDERAIFAEGVGDWGSFLRVVTAPVGFTRAELHFEVEGVRTLAHNFFTWNLDRTNTSLKYPNQRTNGELAPGGTNAPLCAHLRITSSPTTLMLNLSESPSAFDTPFVVQALDSNGAPVATPLVGMYVVDSLGAFVYKVFDSFDTVSRESTRTLRSLGGAGALLLGNYTASVLMSVQLPAPTHEADSDARGITSFSNMSVFLSQNTWVRFAFVARYPNITQYSPYHTFPDPLLPDIFTTTGCVSQFSAPITVFSSIASISLLETSGSVSRSVDISTAVTTEADFPVAPPMPNAQFVDAGGKLLRPYWESMFVSAADEALTLIPAHVSMNTFKYEPRLSDDLLTLYRLLRQQPISIDRDHSYWGRDIFLPSSVSLALGSSMFGTLMFAWNKISNISDLSHIDLNASAASGPGTTNAYSYFGGVTSDTGIPISVVDDVNELVLDAWGEPGIAGPFPTYSSPPLCPSGFKVSAYNQSSTTVGSVLPLVGPWPIDQCNGCSGNGVCRCGVCVCLGGWHGSTDCSIRVAPDDSIGLSKYYQDAGLPVYDVRRVRERAVNSSYVGELFPRFFLARSIGLGKLATSDHDALRANIAAAPEVYSDTPLLPPSVILGDAANAFFLSNTMPVPPVGLNQSLFESFKPSPLIKSVLSVVYPSLVTCAGEPVHGWAFSSPIRGGCIADSYSLSTHSMLNRLFTDEEPYFGSGFSESVPRLIRDLSTGETIIENRMDHRIVLIGIPSGCYRFRYGYAPQGPGSLSQRNVGDVLTTSLATSVGSSRPFQVIAPVLQLTVTTADAKTGEPIKEGINTMHVPLGARFKFDFVVTLDVRSGDDASIPFQDKCSDDQITEIVYHDVSQTNQNKQTAPYRCPFLPSGGIEVTVTAVSRLSGIAYSLFAPLRTNDCARTFPQPRYTAAQNPLADNFLYVATFKSLELPQSPALPPFVFASDQLSSLPIPTGTYILRFSAMGVSADALFTITVVDNAMKLIVFNSLTFVSLDLSSSSDLIDVVDQNATWATQLVPVNVTRTPETNSSLRLFSVVADTLNFNELIKDDMMTISSFATTAVLLGPENSNIDLGLWLGFSLTNGMLDLSRTFYSGKSGLYLVKITLSQTASRQNLSPSVVLALNVTNPVSSVTLQNSNDLPSSVSTPLSFSATASQTLSYSMRVCAVGSASFNSEPLLLRMFVAPSLIPTSVLSPDACTPADDEPLYFTAARAQSHVPLITGGLETKRNEIDLGFKVVVRAGDGVAPVTCAVGRSCGAVLGSDGCATLDTMVFTSVAVTTKVVLVASVRGVEAPFVTFSVLSLADANPVSISGLQTRLLVPLLIVLPLFTANSMQMSLPARAAALLIALGSLTYLGFTDTVNFVKATRSLDAYYSAIEVMNVKALDNLYIVAFTVVAGLAAIAAVLVAAKIVSLWCKRASAPFSTNFKYISLLSRWEAGFADFRERVATEYVRRLFARRNARGEIEPLKRKAGCQWANFTFRFPLEDEHTSFFYPQRLLISMIVAILACGMAGMLLARAAVNAGPAAKLWVAAVAARLNAAQAAAARLAMDQAANVRRVALAAITEIPLEEVTGSTVDPSALALARASIYTSLDQALSATAPGGPLLAAAGDVVNAGFVNTVFNATANATACLATKLDINGAVLSPAMQKIIASTQAQGSALASGADPVRATLGAVAALEADAMGTINIWIDAASNSLNTAVMAALGFTSIYVLITMVMFLLNYKTIVLALRSGNERALPRMFASQWDRTRVSPDKAVDFIGLMVAGTLYSFLLLSLVLTSVFFLLSVATVRSYIYTLGLTALSALLGSGLIMLLVKQLLKRFTIYRGVVVFPNLYAIADLYLSFIGLVTGVISTILRLAILFAGVLSGLMRPDIFAMPGALTFDGFSCSFVAMLTMDTFYSNPCVMVATEALTEALIAARTRREVIAVRKSESGGSGSESGDSESQSIVVQNPLTLGVARNGGGGADNTPPVKRSIGVRIRTRWQLAAMLVRNPSLTAHRKHALEARAAEKTAARELFMKENVREVGVGGKRDGWLITAWRRKVRGATTRVKGEVVQV